MSCVFLVLNQEVRCLEVCKVPLSYVKQQLCQKDRKVGVTAGYLVRV